MATRDELEAREAGCSSAEDYIALAREALAEPADPDYAKDLLEKGEIECQFPGQYVAVAEAAVAAGLTEYADDVYEQAEEACFEGAEFARLGHSLGAVRGNKDKAREMLEKAAAEAKTIPQFLTIAASAREAVGDEALANRLLEKVEGDCKTIADYQGLAASVLKETGDAGAARGFYVKAEKFAMDLDSTIRFAEGAAVVFGDKEWVAEILSEAEGDCQFTGQFVALAGANHRLTGDAGKVGELMEQAEEFAMSGEEQIQLAEGAWKLLGDREKAAAAYEKALGGISDRDQLFGLAATVAKELEDRGLAKKVYAKAEEKLLGVADACKLARAVKADLADEAFAGEIYGRAEARFTAPADAGALARDILEVLGDKARAEGLFQKCLTGTEGFADLGKLLATAREGVGSEGLNRAILTKQAAAAATPTEFLAAADLAVEVLGDKAMAGGLIDTAEESVTTLAEMKAVVGAVDRHLADDAARVTRVKEKLAKREANQGAYTEFQKREGEAVTSRQYLKLTEEMMAALDDRYYAAKLLGAAEAALGEAIFNLPGTRDLVLAVEKHLGDRAWMKRLLDAAGKRADTFAEMRTLARVAALEIEDLEFGAEWARGFLKTRAEGLAAKEGAGPYEFTKMAGGVLSELGDKAWAGRLLAEAETRATTPFEISHIGRMYKGIGDAAKAGTLFEKAVAKCGEARECVRLVSSYKDMGLDAAKLRQHYESCGKGLGSARQKLRWAEGIIEVFGDRDWAKREFEGLAPSLTAEPDRRRFLASQEVHFGRRFC